MQTKYKVILVVVTLATTFAVGRYTSPEKVKIEKQVVTVEKQVDKTKTNTKSHEHKDTTIVETVKPDGTKTTVTHTTDDTHTGEDSQSIASNSSSTQQNESKEVSRSSSHLTISALAGPQLSFSHGLSTGPFAYGVHVSRPLIGPINMGLWGLNTGVVGVSLGLTF